MFNLPRTTLTFRRELRLRSQGARIRGKPKIINFFKALLLYSFVVLLLAVPAFAAVGSVSQQEFEGAISGGFNKESFDFQTFSDVINSANTAILGCTSEACPQELKVGAVNTMGGLIAALYANPPVSGVQYLADISSRFGIVKPAYAQERTGFQALAPILPIWRAFRNLAYLAFVIIFVVMGFAIMFRVKISPQAVITIQSALPRIVIALILVTFSYAIAGFLIDLIYVLTFLVITLFSAPGIELLNAEAARQWILQGNVLTFIRLFFDFAGGLGSAVNEIVQGIIQLPGISLVGGVFFGGLTVLIFAIAFLFAIVRLFFSLLMAYIGIIVGVIFAPIQLLLGVLPTEGVGFGSWFRNILANVLAFPAAAVMLLIAAILVHSGTLGAPQPEPGTQPLFVPPLLSVGGSLSAVTSLIGIGILLMTYKVVDMVKEAIKVPPFKYGVAITEPIAAAGGALLQRYRRIRAEQVERAFEAKPGGLSEFEKELLRRTRPPR